MFELATKSLNRAKLTKNQPPSHPPSRSPRLQCPSPQLLNQKKRWRLSSPPVATRTAKKTKETPKRTLREMNEGLFVQPCAV